MPPHLLNAFATDPRLVAYDIGAAGLIPENWNAAAALLNVYAFDARPGSVKHPAEARGLEFHKIETAIGGANDPARKFYETRGPGGSSFLRMDPKWTARTSPADYSELLAEHTLAVRTLSDVIEKGEARAPNFLKLDIQGAELEVLEALKPEHRTDIDGMIVEVEFVPLYENQPLFEDIHAMMREYGLTIFDLRTHRMYRPVDGKPFEWYRKHKGYARGSTLLGGRLVAGDALYFRDFEDRPPETPDGVKRLALLLVMHHFFDQAWAAVDVAQGNGVLDKADAAELKRAVIAACPDPRPWERAGRWAKRLFRWRSRLGGGPDLDLGWMRRRWPDQ
jgi:FkbM family methyltransferase